MLPKGGQLGRSVLGSSYQFENFAGFVFGLISFRSIPSLMFRIKYLFRMKGKIRTRYLAFQFSSTTSFLNIHLCERLKCNILKRAERSKCNTLELSLTLFKIVLYKGGLNFFFILVVNTHFFIEISTEQNVATKLKGNCKFFVQAKQ